MLVGWPHILVVSPITRKLRRIRRKLSAWSCSLDEILGTRPLQSVPCLASEALEVGRVHVQMRPLQLIVLLIAVDYIGNQLLLIEAALINRVLGQVRLDDVQLAEVPPTFTLIANALLAVVVLEVMTQQLRGRLLEAELLSEAELMVMGASLGFTELADVQRDALVSQFEISRHSALELGLELQLLRGVVNRSLGERSHRGSSSSNNFINLQGIVRFNIIHPIYQKQHLTPALQLSLIVPRQIAPSLYMSNQLVIERQEIYQKRKSSLFTQNEKKTELSIPIAKKKRSDPKVQQFVMLCLTLPWSQSFQQRLNSQLPQEHLSPSLRRRPQSCLLNILTLNSQGFLLYFLALSRKLCIWANPFPTRTNILCSAQFTLHTRLASFLKTSSPWNLKQPSPATKRHLNRSWRDRRMASICSILTDETSQVSSSSSSRMLLRAFVSLMSSLILASRSRSLLRLSLLISAKEGSTQQLLSLKFQIQSELSRLMLLFSWGKRMFEHFREKN